MFILVLGTDGQKLNASALTKGTWNVGYRSKKNQTKKKRKEKDLCMEVRTSLQKEAEKNSNGSNK